MSLLSGGFISGDKLVLGEYLIALPQHVLARVRDHQSVTLGMRQEAVTISIDSTSTNGITIPAKVESAEADYVHRTQTVHLRTGQWNYSGLCSLDLNLSIGQPVHVELERESLYVFDAKSGVCI